MAESAQWTVGNPGRLRRLRLGCVGGLLRCVVEDPNVEKIRISGPPENELPYAPAVLDVRITVDRSSPFLRLRGFGPIPGPPQS
jgi:hypothetical protein